MLPLGVVLNQATRWHLQVGRSRWLAWKVPAGVLLLVRLSHGRQDAVFRPAMEEAGVSAAAQKKIYEKGFTCLRLLLVEEYPGQRARHAEVTFWLRPHSQCRVLACGKPLVHS